MGDSRGYYHDGAYTAAPDYYPPSDDEEEEEGEYRDSDQQPDPTTANRAALSEAYFASLTTRFLALRSQLHRPPPQSALDALPDEHETSVPSFAAPTAAFRTWTHRIRYTDPLPAQVAAMDKLSVLRLLRVVLGGKFFRRGCALRQRTSRWIWALLARLPDAGEMDSDEVGAVRELGKRAVVVSIAQEHVVALCELLGREQVVGLGLSGVLREIEGRVGGKGGDHLVGGVEGGREDAGVVNEDEILLSSEKDGEGVAAEVRVNGTVDNGLDLEDGELPEEDGQALDPQAAGTQIDGTDEGEMPMDIEEEGDGSNEPSSTDDALAAMKERLLSDLDKAETWGGPPPPSPPTAKEPAGDDETADLINMRATVNMILTVAGEFYGQRDLLAFRDPFGDVPFENDGAEDRL